MEGRGVGTTDNTIASSACKSKSSIVPVPWVIALIALTFNSFTPSAM